jgi:hypothetical protein
MASEQESKTERYKAPNSSAHKSEARGERICISTVRELNDADKDLRDDEGEVSLFFFDEEMTPVKQTTRSVSRKAIERQLRLEEMLKTKSSK